MAEVISSVGSPLGEEIPTEERMLREDVVSDGAESN
jgi:hypothetical protein